MKNPTIQVFITTYERPEMLLTLLKDIYKQSKDFNIDLLIIRDKGSADYKKTISYLKRYFSFNHAFFEVQTHQGKKNYWQLINYGYMYLKNKSFDYLIQIPDDVRLIDNFFKVSVELYSHINDKKKACLNILADRRRFTAQWTEIQPKQLNKDIIKTGWVDMAYISTKNYLKALNYEILPVPISWASNKKRSSGVGMQISQRLVSKGYNLYNVVNSLIYHGSHNSVMHPNERKQNPIISISNERKDKITASIASMPSRIRSLEEAVASILPQVDILEVYLNEFTEAPKFLKHKKIKTYLSKDLLGNLGDAGKFFNSAEIKGYHFTIDDDIIYPKDYVETAINAIDRNNRKVVVTFHGRRFKDFPVQSYYRSISERYSCLRNQHKDEYIHVCGTGVLAYHTDTIKFNIKDFKLINMADIWAGIKCQENKVPILCLNHKKGWILESKKYDRNESIFKVCAHQDKEQTKTFNSITWQLYTA